MKAMYSKSCLKLPLSKRRNIGLVVRTNYSLIQAKSIAEEGGHSEILSTFIAFVNKIFVLSIFERPLKTGFTVFR